MTPNKNRQILLASRPHGEPTLDNFKLVETDVPVVGQIAKLKGCCAIGIAGGEQKCRFVTEELGFDACLDHRQPDLAERLKAACPNGIDIYFENVGGVVFAAVLPLLNNFARIPVC